MCRLALYAGPPIPLSLLLVDPVNSLIRQSIHSAEGKQPVNGDGFGVAWYAPDITPEPGVLRSLSPAWSNQNLIQIAKATRSGCILAHVRAASPGMVVSETNCHPFWNKQFTFMHNGSLAGYRQLRRELLRGLSEEAFHSIGGTTDSEHMFALFRDKLAVLEGGSPDENMATALRETIHHAMNLSRETDATTRTYLNIAVCDGRHAVISRYTDDPDFAASLYVCSGVQCACEDGIFKIIDAPEGSGAVIVSSERLSDGESWQPVPVNHMVIIDANHRARIVAIE